MRLLGGREASCRGSMWCSAVKTPPAAPRPGLHRRLHQQRQRSEEEPCTRPEPLLVCLPVLEAQLAAGSSSRSRSSSSSSSVGGPGSWPQLAYWDVVPRLQPLAFVEVQEGPQHLSVQLDEPQPQQQDEEKKHKDYYANVGDCIRTLREDIPMLFAKDLNYEIYREDMVFKDPRISFRGLRNYKLVIWSLRFHGKLFFQQPYVEVSRIWQPEDNIIKMRWAVHGRPRVSMSAQNTRYQFDGISTYKLDKNGQIYEHAIDNMQLRDPPITNPLLYGWNIIAQPLVPQQQPCPGAWFREGEDVLPGSVASAGQQ